MNLEIQEDTSYTFTYTKTIEGSLPGTITTATLRILGADGTVYQSSTAMTIASPTATKSINFSTDPTGLTYARDRNYKVEFTIDGNIYIRFFDIVRTPFTNMVVDQDLINENIALLDGMAEQSGQATSGTTVTLVDLSRNEIDDYWNGGKLTIMPILDTGVVMECTVTDFVKSTGTLTFTPAITAITTERYFVRRSYKGLTDRAAEKVREEIASQGHPAYLMIDDTQANRLIIYKALEQWFQQKRSEEGDKFDLQFKYYQEQYKKQFDSIPLVFDVDDDGNISDDEESGESFLSVSLSR